LWGDRKKSPRLFVFYSKTLQFFLNRVLQQRARVFSSLINQLTLCHRKRDQTLDQFFRRRDSVSAWLTFDTLTIPTVPSWLAFFAAQRSDF
jgi:hypothetical protein